MWSTIWRLDAESTASHARRKDPSSGLIDVMLLGAAAASLTAMGIVLAGHGSGIAFNETAAPGLWRLRLAVLHDRHDVPALRHRHRHRIEADTADRAAARVAVVPLGAVIMATTINAVALAMTLMRFQAGGQGPLGWMSPRVVRWVQTGDRFTYLVRDPRGRLTERRAPRSGPL